MKIIKANNKEYKLEFSYEAAECKELVQKMFNVRSGAYLVSESDNLEKDPSVLDMLKGTVSMISDIPSICRIGFYAGLLENNKVTEEESKDIMKSFMKENNISYRKLAEDMHMSLNAINNKLNGYTVFNIYEAEKMMIILGIGNNEIKKYWQPPPRGLPLRCSKKQQPPRWGQLLLRILPNYFTMLATSAAKSSSRFSMPSPFS